MTWRYVASDDDFELLAKSDSIVLDISCYTAAELQNAQEIAIEYKSVDKNYKQQLRFEAVDGSLCTFIRLASPTVVTTERNFIMDYNHPLYLQIVSPSERDYYIQKATSENVMEQRRISNKIKRTLINEPSEFRNIYRFMLELNDKLDVLIDLVKDEKDEAQMELTKVHGVGLSTAGFIIHHTESIPDGTLAYTKNMMGAIEERLVFSSILSITKLKDAVNGYFYNAEFVRLSEDVKDSIVKHLFTIEREVMKGMRKR